MDLREMQRPLKERYREDPATSRITLHAKASEQDAPTACAVDTGRAIQEAQAHTGVGGPGTAACSGDLLLGALAACAQITCQMVAAAMGIETERIEVLVDGDLDLAGTLGVNREASVGFDSIRLRFEVDAPSASAEEIDSLIVKTERYCTVLQTLRQPPPITAA
ncbi:MAG: OsmC family protein [Solirubrobacterales bacterium]